jgi:FSR family fosmidomycin resistance protein-like MFS transporter
MMNEVKPAANIATPEYRTQQGSYLILFCFFLSHATFHFMAQSFSVMLPAVKNTFGINPVQIGAIITAKELAAGLSSLPGGLLSDYLRHQRVRIMTLCMLVFAAGWLIIAFAPFYQLLMVGMMIIAVAGTVWHLPSLAELGRLFTHSRGTVLAVHGAGGSLGDILGPVITGLLLGLMSWQGILSMYTVVPLIMAIWIFWAFGRSDNALNVAKESGPGEKKDLKAQLKITRDILRQTHIWRVNMVAGFRGMCFTILVTFLPLFMHEDLGFSPKSIGFHFGLLWTIGIVASPMMGHLSDRWGRKIVLVPSLLYSCVFIILLALIGNGGWFTLIIVMLGISIRSDYSLVSATLLDITGDQIATTMLGVLSFTRFLMGAASPLIAGALYQYYGMQATLFFMAVLFLASAIIFSSIDLNKKSEIFL